MRKTLLAIVASAFVGVGAQSGAWGQCGGIGWTGATTCISGWTCVYSNDWYSQCLQASATTARTTSTMVRTTTTTARTTSTPTTARTTSTTTHSTTTTSSGAVTTAAGQQIRAVQDPVFHFYIQNQAGIAVLGPVGSSGYFTISGSIKDNVTGQYMNIASGTASYRQITFGSTATFSGWALEGDTIITAQTSTYGRQLNFLACTTSDSTIYTVYLQLGNDLPSGTTCTMISLHLPCLC